jgi:hypothetical protein
VTNNNGFWIRLLDLLALLYNYNQLQQLTVNDCLRLALFLIGQRVSSLPLRRNDERRIPARTLNYLERLLSDESLILSLSLVLRSTVSRPVCLEIKHPSGSYDEIFITVRQLRVC